MLLSNLVTAAADTAATRSRLTKVEVLATLFRALATDAEEIPAAVGLLIGKPRQGKLNVGWRTLAEHRSEPAPQATLSLGDVDRALTDLAQVSPGAGSAGRRVAAVGALFGRATAAEQEYLMRALLGDVRTGALEGVLLDAVARAADRPGDEVRRAAMLTGDLGRTAELALRGEDLSGIGLTPGMPVLPMLAGTAATPTEALAALGPGQPASVEYKMDGARVQVHRAGGVVTVYTRSLADITARVPELVSLVAAFPGGDLVLDGETLTLDADGRARPFAESMSRFGAQAVREAQLAVWFFDLLHADGTDYLDEPLSRRREVLRAVVGDRLMPGEVTEDPATAERVFADAVATGHEGVVVKELTSAYQAGRRGQGWIKVKPVHTFDLVVLGAEWGYGRRQGWLSNLHLGARDPDGRFGEPGGFVMVGKTFKGLTDELLRWQTDFFPAIAVRETKTTVFTEPSTVVEIAIDGVQRSTRYPGGVALRFARVKGYRVETRATGTGKPAEQADTIDSLRALLPDP